MRLKFLIVLLLGVFFFDKSFSQEPKYYGWDFKVIKIKDHYYLLNQEVFKPRENGEFGENYIYKVEEDTNFVDLAYKLKVSYYELKEANKSVDPFKVEKGTVITIPLKKKLPENFNYNTVYVSLKDKRLYYPIKLEDGDYVITFPVGTGDEEYPTPTGEFAITEKKINPDWIVPPSARANNPKLPPVVPFGSPENGLGTRALRLNESSYMIHGTSKRSEKGVGMKISYGCIVMRNKDIERLYDLVDLNTKVIIFE
ncbi:ErfK/YbiS/YcfS/YnhG family protein [Sulfurihydrogenibium sp. YO3AOP1]|uniref:L,D-transpeptidase family protein n=1 Tax=Sulfurihydrogenibium sp. (strain YO3AOP1) TaxID=436114 RepID=UPI00017250B3|nr:L,D-transpeptidase family protein [Sulfurihydrogenibium sp. YO3AOP1]ACD66588.1 ErfK/YbiS/YcfS/YnhG family protein [Sulfurihydrogenibium sp. YO3AOP1]